VYSTNSDLNSSSENVVFNGSAFTVRELEFANCSSCAVNSSSGMCSELQLSSIQFKCCEHDCDKTFHTNIFDLFSSNRCARECYTCSNKTKTTTDFPPLTDLRALATSSNEGLSDGSSAQHCFIRVKMPECTPSQSLGESGGR